MTISLLFVLAAAGAAFWLLVDVGRGGGDAGRKRRNLARLNLAVLVLLGSLALYARIWPLGLMLMLAAFGVSLTERWTARRRIEGDARSGPAGARPPAAPAPGSMTLEEARAILGVGEGARPEEIDAAYRRLMLKVHPDQGGSDYFAAKVNAARDLLAPKR